MWWLVKHLPPESALVKAEDPSAVWSVSEHLSAITANWLAELTYVTTLVNTAEKERKKVQRPEPIIRPGETPPVKTSRRHGPRPRVGAPMDPRLFGGEHIETTAEEVTL